MRPLEDLSIPMRFALLASAICNNSSVIKEEDGNWKPVGDSTEVALFVAAHRARAPKTFWLTQLGLSFIMEFAFDSDRKRMSAVYRLSASSIAEGHVCGLSIPSGATHMVVAKGASEAILSQCNSYLSSAASSSSTDEKSTSTAAAAAASGKFSGSIQPLQSDSVRMIEREGDHMAHQGMRVLALAVRFVGDAEVTNWLAAQKAQVEGGGKRSTDSKAAAAPAAADSELSEVSHQAERELVCVGLAGIVDPPREVVKKAIAECHRAGIRVVMITGDHAATALAIARQIGIAGSDPATSRVINGDTLSALSDEQLTALDPFPCVFSRVSPDNKLKIVRALQKKKEIAAMTGDGVNDAAAIKQADVGIAMGQTGTEITRQAADVILADDNFATIVRAVEEGRRIFDNIIKFNMFLLSCNFSEVLLMLICIAAKMPSPATSIMILWANIFADVPPSIALGVEPAETDIMERRPRSTEMGVLTLTTSLIVFINSLAMCLLSFCIYCWVLYGEGYDEVSARSVCYMSINALHLVHAFHCRSLTASIFTKGMLSNKKMLLGVFISCIGFGMSFYVPGLNTLVQIRPVSGLDFGRILIPLVAHLMFMEAEKGLLRHFRITSE